MDKIKIIPINKPPIIHFCNKNVVLPVAWQKKVDAYWQGLSDSGRSYTRGEVYTVTQKKSESGRVQIIVEKSDYAHYLYCQDIDATMAGYGVHVIFGCCIVETADHYFAMGKMGAHTARAGMYQLCGGGIDDGDLVGDCFDVSHSIGRELDEELGIDIRDKSFVKSFESAFIKEGGVTKKMAIVYRAKLSCTSEELLEMYKDYAHKLRESGERPEFDEVFAIAQDKVSVEDFLLEHEEKCDEYIAPLLRYLYCP